MNVKNVILIALALCGGALFLVLQKHSKDYDSSFEQPVSPAIDEPDTRYRAPDFTLVDLDNNEYKLSDSQGDVVVMTFWTTW
jgi:cytochrome oxidase Cu insertion factor (SCO1/SenC/PrrC family)